MPTERTLKAGDTVRLAESAALDTPAGYRAPFDAGTQFTVTRLDGRGAYLRATVLSADGYRYAGPAASFEFVAEVSCVTLPRS